VVDDGSTDETAEIVEAFARNRQEVRLLRQPVNMRLGQAMRDGFAASKGDIVVVFDSDLSYSVDHIGRMLDTMEHQHVAVVVASPYMKGGKTSAVPWNRAQMSKKINRVLAAASQYDIKTVTGMVRAYNGPFIRSLSLKSMGPEINTEILYKAQIMRVRVAEIPAHLDWSDQAERMASRRVSLRVTTTSKLLVFASFLYRPILFFMVPGLLLLGISMWSTGSLSWTVWRAAEHSAGGLDARITDGFAQAWTLRPQTFIIAGFTFVVAVQLISLGLLATQAKRYFEELFYAITRDARR
jgi:glycosyltransferase involved in cell wall biosynthesis